MKTDYSKLFENVSIGNVELKNRFVMAPMVLIHDFEEGALTEGSSEYYLERAKGGVGLIITCGSKVDNEIEQVAFDNLAPNQNPQLFISRLEKLTSEMNKYDSKLFVQLSAGFGRAVVPQVSVNDTFVAPSEVTNRWDPRVTHRELTTEEVEEMVTKFGTAAKNCKDGGAAGVEIHALHEGYLLDSFSMELFNQRTDKYGGSLENRLRFAREIREEIAKTCGKDFPVSMSFSLKSYIKQIREGGLPGENFEELGRDTAEGLEVAKLLEQYGYDALNVDAGTYDSWYWAHPPMYFDKGCYLPFAKAVKEVVNIPVITAGRLGYPDLALQSVEKEETDFVSLGRPLIADSDFCNKLQEGNEEQIRPCLSCHEGCMAGPVPKPSNCVVNPRAGKEFSEPIEPKTESVKTVAIIGGGPIGMECARLLASKGHSVDLFEASDKLGGLFNYAGIPDFKSDVLDLILWWKSEIKRNDVNIHLNTPVSSESNFLKDFDVIICATGSNDLIPPIDGIDGKNVKTAKAVLGGEEVANNLTIIGGGLVGCELAIWLSNQGKKVSIIEMAPKLLPKGAPMPNELMINAILKDNKVDVRVNSKVVKIAEDKVVVEIDDNKEDINSDCVIMALGYTSEKVLYEQLKEKYSCVHNIGDSKNVADVLYGVSDAYNLCKNI